MIFISFSSEDKEAADQVTDVMRDAGIPIWYSPTHIKPGENYASEIPKALRQSSCVVIIHSANACKSPHILRELEISMNLRKPVYPLRLTDDAPTDAMEYYLSGVQWHDLHYDFKRQVWAFVDFLSTTSAFARQSINAESRIGESRESKADLLPSSRIRVIENAESDIIERLLTEAIEIDRESYADDFVGILDRCLAWYEVNPEIYTFATDSAGTTVGYINAMPVEKDTFDLMLMGSLLDNEIDPEAIIRLSFPGEFYLYFCSIGVAGSHKNSNVFRSLFDAFIRKMHRWYDDGFVVRNIVSDAVTRDGVKMCEMIGCEESGHSEHGSSIFNLTMLPPRIKPTTPKVRSLIRKYREYCDEIGKP